MTALVMTGAYGIFSIIQNEKPASEVKTHKQAATEPSTKSVAPSIIRNTTKSSNSFSPDNASNISATLDHQHQIAEITKLIEGGRFTIAVEHLDSLYRQLSSEQLQEFEHLFLNTASQLWQADNNLQAINLLTSYNETFNSLNGWTLLSNIHLKNTNWQPAINALLKATALEHQPDQLQSLMSKLSVAASNQRAIMEGQKDELGINQLYQNLYQQHPDYARFQLELAYSYLRLNDTSTARSLLEPLQYDAEYGDIAKAALSNLDKNSDVVAQQPQTKKEVSTRGEVVVPLLRSGNSFFVDTTINNRQLRLLLDTGASITALSESTIKSLNLKATGRSIQLSTANGITESKLYRADQIRLGGLSIKDLVVAEIEFNKNSQIQGLLGTDLLNQLDSRYSYIIDNQRNALIFKSKN